MDPCAEGRQRLVEDSFLSDDLTTTTETIETPIECYWDDHNDLFIDLDLPLLSDTQ
jgi:hypothetical protein